MKKTFLLLLALFIALPAAKADKGMWILKELTKQNKERMRQLGFRMSFDELYSENNPSLYNSVVIFGRGCTGVTVSKHGLIFTNHHCGYSSIQSQSTVDHDYLKDGFVSHKYSEELPIPGLKVKYLKEMLDITPRINQATHGIVNELDRIKAIQKEIAKIENEQDKDPNVSSEVYPFYNNNVFYLIKYDVFRDVRLVFTPPSSIGKFGGDTDNWMWPRHTGDFSVFRVYANADNKPAKYSKDNVPYKPKYFAKISLGGVKKNDFAMTIGFPGSTDRYLSSWGVESRMKNSNEPRIEVRGLKQGVWKKFMSKNQAIRIQYAAKYAQSANYWKNSIGMNKGLNKLHVVDQKRILESKFQKWVDANPTRKEKYGFVLDSLRIPTEKMANLERDLTYLSEAFRGLELGSLIAQPAAYEKADLDDIYKDFSPVVAKATLPVMLNIVKEKVDTAYLPDVYALIQTKFGGDYNKYADYVYDNSVYVSKDKLRDALKDSTFINKYKADPAYQLVKSFQNSYFKLFPKLKENRYQLEKGNRLFFAGLKEMDPKQPLPSDANFTMRMSYGNVSGYQPRDAVWYEYFSTYKGILEKYNPDDDEFYVQPEIINMLRKKDFGKYSDSKDVLRLCFLSNNDITGGNSGSPVFNKNGHLIGLAFDGNWEAMSGDIEFEPNLQRTISVDIRYVMWIIDVWGKSKYLVDEVKFMKD